MKPFSNRGYVDEDIIHFSWDTETDGLGGELLAITANDFKRGYYFIGDNMVDDFINLCKDNPYPAVWFAHHAQYDWRYLINYIVSNQVPCEINMRNDTDIYQIILHIDGKKIVMRDSLALFPSKLSDFAKTFCPEIPKQSIDIEHFDPLNPSHKDYAMRDAEILRVGMPRFSAMVERHFGVKLAHTTAGTALKAWQATLPDRVMFAPSEMGEREDFIRGGYYGGLVFLTRTDEITGALTFDINSSYPDVMSRLGVPWGTTAHVTELVAGKMGIYRVIVEAPDNLVIPIIPRRDDKGHMHWNRGIFETTATNEEILFAEQHGYIIHKIIEGIIWERRIFPFNDFINKCKELRKKYKGKPEEKLAKLMQNSLYGKFGSKRERMKIFVPTCDDDIIGAEPLDENEYFFMRSEISDSLRCIPEWAVFITAHARLHIMDVAYSVGVENVVYGDTDSLTVLPHVADQFDCGPEYGQFKLEKQWRTFRAIAPKVYTGQLDNGDWTGAAKGLPKNKMNDEIWSQLMQDYNVNLDYLSLPSLRVSINNGIKPAISRQRRVSSLVHSSHWELQNGRVRPKIIRESRGENA